MSAWAVLAVTAIASVIAALVRGVFVDEIKHYLHQRRLRRLDRAIANLPEDLQARWGDAWREKLSSFLSLPITALRFELSVRRLPGRLKSAEEDLERTIAAMSPKLQEEWAEEWRGELRRLVDTDPLAAARWVRGVRRSARALTTPAIGRLSVDRQITVPRWARQAQRTRDGTRRRTTSVRVLEHRALLVTTTCLLVVGGVMIYNAAALESADGVFGWMMLERFTFYAAFGLVLMFVIRRGGLGLVVMATQPLLFASFVLLLIVKTPLGVTADGAQRWLGDGMLMFQPSEVMKLALVLYTAKLLAERPKILARPQFLMPWGIVAGSAVLLIASEPDLGTALVISFTLCAMLVAAGMPLRWLAIGICVGALLVVIFALAEPYRRDRLLSFADPWAHASDESYQAIQGRTAIHAGGLFGRGLGNPEPNLFVPRARTDYILAVVGEELGVVGICGILFLYGLVAYVGLRVARNAPGNYAKLLAAGVTSLYLSQGTLNIFTVLGLAPVVGVPLPFISYTSTNLIVLLAGMGILLNVAAGGRVKLRPVPDVAGGAGPALSG